MSSATRINSMSDVTISDASDLEGKYLTFNLMDEHYGVNVDWILQIVAVSDITKIPNMPYFVKGVINLRGRIIPVMDLRLKFALPEKEYDERTCIIIIRIVEANFEVFIGMIVDKVLEVLDIHTPDLEKAPTFGVDIESQFILGMAKVKNKIVTLLNITNILTKSELKTLQRPPNL